MTTAESKTQSGPDDALRARATQAYAQQSRQAREQQWILQYLPLVRHVVSKVTAKLTYKKDVEDLISAGTLGLVKAARAYDPSQETSFKTYAYIRIRGAVIDELRGRTFAPAGIHARVREAKEAYEQCLAELGRPPGDEELAEKLGLSLDELYRLFEDMRKQHFLSIHGLSDDEPAILGRLTPADNEPSPADKAEHKETLERLLQAIRELPERDRIVILLYYERDLTMKEAATVLEVTESRVSQLHAGALFKLAMKLKETS
ncbi:MAG: sigma-70 family RNA polymerase sigma factor [Phycisphaerae bacterium]